jgi:hypothetical protein
VFDVHDNFFFNNEDLYNDMINYFI